MLIKSIKFNKTACGVSLCLCLATPAFSQALPDPSYMEALNNMALEMTQTSLVPAAPTTQTAANLPQIGEQASGDQVDCAAFSAMTENGQGNLVLEGNAQQSADDQLAEIANCYAEVTVEGSASEPSLVVASGS